MAEHARDSLTIVTFVHEVQFERQILFRLLSKPQELELGEYPRHYPDQQL